jgi:hypothetical protein
VETRCDCVLYVVFLSDMKCTAGVLLCAVLHHLFAWLCLCSLLPPAWTGLACVLCKQKMQVFAMCQFGTRAACGKLSAASVYGVHGMLQLLVCNKHSLVVLLACLQHLGGDAPASVLTHVSDLPMHCMVITCCDSLCSRLGVHSAAHTVAWRSCFDFDCALVDCRAARLCIVVLLRYGRVVRS